MLVKTHATFVLALAFALTPASAAQTVLDVSGPSLVVLDAAAGLNLTRADGHRPIVLEASATHRVLAMTGPGTLTVEGDGVRSEVTPVGLRELRLDAIRALAFYRVPDRKEEDHEIDPDPKAERPVLTLLTMGSGLVFKEEDHEIDPDPKARDERWAEDWSLMSAAVSDLGPGWYFVVRDGEVSYEIVIERRS